MKRTAIIFMLISGLALSEPMNPLAITWKNLSDVQFTRKLNKEVSMYFLYPSFGQSVKALQGKEIQIKGYIIPVDENENIYVVSAQPMAACFFCGGAGPESIMELQFKNKKQRFKTDEQKTVKGTLQLNPSDIEHLNYILKNVEVVN